MDVWSTISEGTASPRTEIVYNIEALRAGLRQGDWKLIWRAPLPSVMELYNVTQDPSEKDNLAAANPDKVAALQKRVNELAATMAKSPLLETEMQAMMKRIAAPAALPDEESSLIRRTEWRDVRRRCGWESAISRVAQLYAVILVPRCRVRCRCGWDR